MGCCSNKWPPAPPTFNLTCDIWHQPAGAPPFLAPPIAPTLVGVPCKLSWGELVSTVDTGGILLNWAYIGMDKATDIHWARGGFPGNDYLECPPGSGMWYKVMFVFNVGYQYPNDYRVARCLPVAPFPTPLP